jgi:hypothetical protein
MRSRQWQSRLAHEFFSDIILGMNQMSVFEPQQIGGKWVTPLCLPTTDSIISRSISACVNLIWFSLNIASHQNDNDEVGRLALMCKAVISIEHKGVSITSDDELQEAIDRIDEVVNSQADDYDNDEQTNDGDEPSDDD